MVSAPIYIVWRMQRYYDSVHLHMCSRAIAHLPICMLSVLSMRKVYPTFSIHLSKRQIPEITKRLRAISNATQVGSYFVAQLVCV